MKLTEDQQRQIAQNLADGAGIADIQRLVNDTFKIPMTYMEVRFLLDDLDLDLLAPKQPEPAQNPEADAIDAEADLVEDEFADDYSNGGVTVEIDRLMRPGTALSGTVTFSDGVKAKWFLDQYGRLGLEAEKEGYKPSPEDIREFQLQLQSKMR